jgi:hypothetical protein
MDNVASKLKEAIGGLTEILIGAIGLLVVVQVVFGTGGGGIDIIGNITWRGELLRWSGRQLGQYCGLVNRDVGSQSKRLTNRSGINLIKREAFSDAFLFFWKNIQYGFARFCLIRQGAGYVYF